MIQGGQTEAGKIRYIKIPEYFPGFHDIHTQKIFSFEPGQIRQKRSSRYCDYIACNPDGSLISKIFLHKEGLRGKGSKKHYDPFAPFCVKVTIDNDSTDRGYDHDTAQSQGILPEDPSEFYGFVLQSHCK